MLTFLGGILVACIGGFFLLRSKEKELMSTRETLAVRNRELDLKEQELKDNRNNEDDKVAKEIREDLRIRWADAKRESQEIKEQLVLSNKKSDSLSTEMDGLSKEVIVLREKVIALTEQGKYYQSRTESAEAETIRVRTERDDLSKQLDMTLRALEEHHIMQAMEARKSPPLYQAELTTIIRQWRSQQTVEQEVDSGAP